MEDRDHRTARQLMTQDNSNRTGEVDRVARAFIMAESDPSFVEKKYINDIIGYGIFATKDLGKGEFVMEYQGELIALEESQRRVKQYDEENVGSFIVYFRNAQGKHLCVDATATDGLGRFVNDGWESEKNCFLREVNCEDKSHICLFASREIKNGEEIRFDYGVTDLPWRNTDAAGNVSKSKTPTKSCGTCQGCMTTDNCRKCRFCLDMKRHGGPGVLKKKCLKKNCLNMSSTRSKSASRKSISRRALDVVSASQPQGSDGMVEVFAKSLASQPVDRGDRMEEKVKDRSKPQPMKLARKRRPQSEGRLQKAKRRKKSSYCSATPRKARSFSASNKIFKSPCKSASSSQASTDPRSKVYDFSSGTANIAVQTDREDAETMNAESSQTGPTQQKHQDTDDLDTAWFEEECIPDSDVDGTLNVQVCTQNDMSYLTQTRYKQNNRVAMMKALQLKPRSGSLDDVVKLHMVDLIKSGCKWNKSRKIVRTDLFGKESASPNGDTEYSKTTAEDVELPREDVELSEEGDEEVAEKDEDCTADKENDRDEDTVSRKITKRQHSQKKKKKLSFIPSNSNSLSPLNDNNNSPQDVSHYITWKRRRNSQLNADSSQETDSDTTTEVIGNYHQSLADILKLLEEASADKSIKIRHKKLAKKVKQKKSQMLGLLKQIALECPDPNETVEVKDADESFVQPSQRKLEGQQAARMLKNLYKTLMSQTAECFQERLDETSYEIKVTFKKDGEKENGSVEPIENVLEEEESFDTKPETWKDISVVVKYTKQHEQSNSEKTKKLVKTKEHMEDVLQFLDTKIQQLRGGEGDVGKIIKKAAKKLKKKMSKVS